VSAPMALEALRRSLSALESRPLTLLAAVSGGCDSMALLQGLARLRQELPITLHACHVQHGLRGESSLLDEQLVRAQCARLGVPLYVHEAQLGGDPTLPGMETRARELRRRFFTADMEAIHADALLLAHHRDDQTETLLMHLLRGAGAAGLAAMQERAPFGCGLLLRPFLALPKQALQEALAQWGAPYREDATNHEALTLRNALRLQVLPLLEQLSPGCTGRMAQTAALLRRDEEALAAQARALYCENRLCLPGLHAIDTGALQAADAAVQVRALRLWYAHGLERMGVTPDERQLSALDSEALLTLLPPERTGAQLNLPCGLTALRGQRLLHLTRQGGEALCPAAEDLPSGESPLPVGGVVSLSGLAADAEALPLPGWIGKDGTPLLMAACARTVPTQAPPSACTVHIPLALAEGCVLRTPRPGDRIHPLGAPGDKPLRRWLTDRKVDQPLRPLLPVLAAGGSILWIPGLCTAQALAFAPDTPCLTLTVNLPLPYLPTTHKGDESHG